MPDKTKSRSMEWKKDDTIKAKRSLSITTIGVIAATTFIPLLQNLGAQFSPDTYAGIVIGGLVTLAVALLRRWIRDNTGD